MQYNTFHLGMAVIGFELSLPCYTTPQVELDVPQYLTDTFTLEPVAGSKNNILQGNKITSYKNVTVTAPQSGTPLYTLMRQCPMQGIVV
jgi:hypothetical protein